MRHIYVLIYNIISTCVYILILYNFTWSRYIHLNLSKSTQKLQFIIVWRKFKIYISAISFERKPSKEGDDAHNPLSLRYPNRWKRDLRKKRWNIFTPSKYMTISIYIYTFDVGWYPLTRVGFFLYYPSVCNTYIATVVFLFWSLLNHFFFLNIFSIIYRSIYSIYPVLCN